MIGGHKRKYAQFLVPTNYVNPLKFCCRFAGFNDTVIIEAFPNTSTNGMDTNSFKIKIASNCLLIRKNFDFFLVPNY